jgi:hypothetical protein
MSILSTMELKSHTAKTFVAATQVVLMPKAKSGTTLGQHSKAGMLFPKGYNESHRFCYFHKSRSVQ